ncbi:hypothetical protein BdWA1_000587 [Babesia duncani]|uniref:Uncharacterized protein n=1 Tax=Babesia duncani TaxID=323732 RepID=A0AAD9PMG1_9APIC|nr:hypothetical protein BdWA1_000587 [Babesia duncani]
MFDVIHRFMSSQNNRNTKHRILTVGNDPLRCATFLHALVSVNDYKAIVIDVEKTRPIANEIEENVESQPLENDDRFVCIPCGYIIAETRQRSWFKGHVWDFFTSYNKAYETIIATENFTLYNVDAVIFVTGPIHAVMDANSAESFFKANAESSALKVLIIDANSCNDTGDEDGNGAHLDKMGNVMHYKVNLSNFKKCKEIVKDIMDNVISKIDICH